MPADEDRDQKTRSENDESATTVSRLLEIEEEIRAEAYANYLKRCGSHEPGSEIEDWSLAVQTVRGRWNVAPADQCRAVGNLVGMPQRPKDGQRLRADVIAIAAHDLKSPLATVVAFVELLLDGGGGDLNGEQTRILSRLRANCSFMVELINDILDSQGLESGALKVAPVRQDACALVRAAAARASAVAAAREVHLALELPGYPMEVWADPRRIGQVLDNLISNALKFSPAGSLVEAGAKALAGWAELWIRDTGPGIDPDERGLLFQKFSRTSVQSPWREKSTGLGLFIVAELVRAHGGVVDVESVPGNGARFSFTLPLARLT